jgi:predicted DNA-binding protein with PD1-like motif
MLGLGEVALDRVGGIDDDAFAGLLVSDEVRRTAEIVVDELGEDHAATVAAGAAFSLEVPRAERERACA